MKQIICFDRKIHSEKLKFLYSIGPDGVPGNPGLFGLPGDKGSMFKFTHILTIIFTLVDSIVRIVNTLNRYLKKKFFFQDEEI